MIDGGDLFNTFQPATAKTSTIGIHRTDATVGMQAVTAFGVFEFLPGVGQKHRKRNCSQHYCYRDAR